MAVFQLSMFPPIIRLIGLTAWQRIGFALSALAFLTVPAVKVVSWNYASLYAASVTANTFVNCGMSAVSGSRRDSQKRPFFFLKSTVSFLVSSGSSL